MVVEFKIGANEDKCVLHLQKLIDEYCGLQAGYIRQGIQITMGLTYSAEVEIVDIMIHYHI